MSQTDSEARGGRRQRWPTGAVVIGGDFLALGVVRSLGRQGIPVWVLASEHLLATTSRYALRALPWPLGDEAEQVEYLLGLADRHHLDGWVLFPTGDEAAALLARAHARLAERFRLAVAPWETLRWAYDKRLTYQLAADLGVDYPWTRYPVSRAQLAALDCPYPAILKPAYKKEVTNPFVRAKAWRVEDREALLARYDAACSLVDPSIIMLQDLVPGGGEAQFSYAALCFEGRSLASLTARRTRQYPVDFGRSSSYVETVEVPGIEEPSRRLIAAMRYTGLVEVEYKWDRRDGRHKLLDINPRVWGWHTLGRRAGVDFPYLYWRMLQGEPVPEVRARSGASWVHLAADALAGAHAIRHGSLSARAYIGSLLRWPEPAVFAADDFLPALAELPLLGYIAWNRRRVGASRPERPFARPTRQAHR